MNSISPQMLGLTAANMTLVTTSRDFDGQPPRPGAPIKRIVRAARRWRWLLIGAVVAGAAAGLGVNMLSTRQYASTVRLQVSRDTAQVVTLGNVSRDTPVGDQEFYQTQYGLLRAQALAERVARDLGVIDDPGFFRTFHKSDVFEATAGPANHAKRSQAAGLILLKRTDIAPIHGSSLVDIEAKTPSPTLSQRIAQTWAQDFIAANLERRLGASGYARQFLEARLGELRGKLERSERRAMDYAASQGIVDLPAPANTNRASVGDSRSLVTDDLIALNAARDGATSERIQAGSHLAAADSQPDASSDALAYRAIGLLRSARADAAAQYAKLASQAGPDDPAAKAAHAQVDALDAALKTEGARVRTALQQTFQAASAREKALGQRVDALKGSLADLRQRSIQYNIYQRDADTNRELYNALLQRFKEVDVAGAVANNNIAVVDPAALPDQPSSPRVVVNLILFTLAGALIGVIGVAALERVDPRITEAGELEETLGLKLLGVAPLLRGQAPLDALNHPRSPLAEAYLAVEANLELSSAQGLPRSFAVTSTGPREGKSITAIALAQALARARRKVVLVDADLRGPSIHTAFGLKNTTGLSNLLSGGDIEAALQPTAQAGLWVIAAGPAPANPVDLFIGDTPARLVKDLQDRFDHVILEGPCVMDRADAPLVASAVQAVVYAVQAGAARTGDIRGALAQLRGAQVVGAVLTKARR